MSQPDQNDSTAQDRTSQETATQGPGSQSPGSQYASEPYSTEQYATSPYSGPPQSQGYPAQGQGGYASQPGYPTPGYAGPQPPSGDPPNPGYPAPYGYPPYGYPVRRGPVRPGGATASAVLMFIQAAVVLISTFYVLFFASLAGSASAAGVSGADPYETEFTIVGILQLVSVGLLIFGGVQLLGGSGRTLTIVACGIQLAFVVYWMIRIGSLPEFDADGTTFFFVVPLMYAVLPLVSLPLALAKPVTDYLAAKKAESNPAA